MILADKIINERKRNGWSQEELAEKLSVSRQSVSKWEGAQSMPDLSKVLQMAELFGVSTDYLLKDEMEPEVVVTGRDLPEEVHSIPPVRRVSMEESREYLNIMEKSSATMGYGVALCVLSPVILLMLLGFAELWNLSETLMCGIGVVTLLVMVAIAVAIFIIDGAKKEKYEFLQKESFETEYGVTGMVKEKREEFRSAAAVGRAIGVVMCILSPVPLIAAALLEAPDYLVLLMVCVLLLVVAIAVNFFVRVGIVEDSYKTLLMEGEYSSERKAKNGTLERIASIYWCLVTAIYLGVSLKMNNWGTSWIIWVVAGLFYAVVDTIAEIVLKVKD